MKVWNMDLGPYLMQSLLMYYVMYKDLCQYLLVRLVDKASLTEFIH